MEYKVSETAHSYDGKPIYEITALDEDELLAKAMAEFMRRGEYVTATMTRDGFTIGGEVKKLGLSYEMLSNSWGIPADVIRYVAETGQSPECYRHEDSIGELHEPLDRLVMTAVHDAWNPEGTARYLIEVLTTAELRKLDKPQLSMATAAKYAGVEEERLARFTKGENCLTPEEISRVCISLLIVDRTLNYRSRRDLFFMGTNPEDIPEKSAP